MKIRILGIALAGFLSACGESGTDEIYNENNTNVVEGIVYDINEKPINGTYKIYYPNGNVKMEVKSKNGKPDGLGRFYDEDGNIVFEGNFKNGLMNGKMLNFYPDSSIHNEINYTNGKPDGLYKTYNQDGTPVVEVLFENGTASKGYAIIQEHKIDLTPEDLQEISEPEQPLQ